MLSAIAASVVFFGGAESAHAEEERPVAFSLVMDESPLDRCGGRQPLVDAVEERLRRRVFTGPDASDIAFEIASEPEVGSTWNARIVEKDRAGAELGRRDVPLATNDCPRAVETLAVVLAIMIGPPRTIREPPVSAEAPPAEAPPAEASPEVVSSAKDEPPRSRTARQTPRRDERLQWAASPLVGVTGGTGVLPGVALAVEAGVIVRPPVRRVTMIARATYWFEVRTPTLPPAEVDRIGLALLGCYDVARPGRFGVRGCVGADGGRIEARSTDLTVPSKSTIAAAVLGEVRLGYRVPVGSELLLEPYLAPQVSALIRRDQFTYRDPSGRERTLLYPAPAAFQASLGVAVHFL